MPIHNASLLRTHNALLLKSLTTFKRRNMGPTIVFIIVSFAIGFVMPHLANMGLVGKKADITPTVPIHAAAEDSVSEYYSRAFGEEAREFCYRGYKMVFFAGTHNGHVIQLIGVDGKPELCGGQ